MIDTTGIHMLITIAAMAGVFTAAAGAGLSALTAWDRGKAIVDSE